MKPKLAAIIDLDLRDWLLPRDMLNYAPCYCEVFIGQVSCYERNETMLILR
jgi:hypothetical protein